MTENVVMDCERGSHGDPTVITHRFDEDPFEDIRLCDAVFEGQLSAVPPLIQRLVTSRPDWESRPCREVTDASRVRSKRSWVLAAISALIGSVTRSGSAKAVRS